MKNYLINRIRRNFILTFSLTIVLLFVVLSITTYVIQVQKTNQLENSFQLSIQKAINHTYDNLVEKYYLGLLNRMINMNDIAKDLHNQDRDLLYEKLKYRFKFFKEENPYLKTMHVHNSDGTSFLRVHKPKIYGDILSDEREMIRNIHQEKKQLLGYERGVVASLFRVMVPLFYNEKYVGAIELGFFPQYIIDHVTDITGFNGFLFIKEEKIDSDKPVSKKVIDGYRLFTKNGLVDILNLPDVNFFNSGEKIKWKNKIYTVYSHTMNNFKGEPKVKMVFLLDVTFVENIRNNILLLNMLIFLVVLVVIIVLININLSVFESRLSNIFKKYSDQIQSKNDFLKTIMDSSPNIVITTFGEKLHTVNKSFLDFFSISSLDEFTEQYECICDRFENRTGYLKKEINGVSWIEYIIDHPDKIHKAMIIENDKEYIFIVNGSLLKFDTQKRYMATLIDISYEVQLQKELKDSEELMLSQSRSAAMGEMISMIAHQWKQPLAVLAMTANNMKADYELDNFKLDDVQIYYKEIEEQVQHLSKTIDDFKDFFKPNKNKQSVLVQQVIDDSLQLIEKSLINNKIQLVKDFKDIGEILMFPNELTHVVVNIVNNAKDVLVHRKIKNKKIHISTYRTNEVIIEIEDNAGGIDSEIMKKIFDPYFTTKERLNGTGIGLYMVKKIVEEHFKGRVEVSNTHIGAKFTIHLPCN